MLLVFSSSRSRRATQPGGAAMIWRRIGGGGSELRVVQDLFGQAFGGLPGRAVDGDLNDVATPAAGVDDIEVGGELRVGDRFGLSGRNEVEVDQECLAAEAETHLLHRAVAVDRARGNVEDGRLVAPERLLRGEELLEFI